MNRHDRRATEARRQPFCPDAKDERGDGLGCPTCRRFEVRSHPVTCDVHGSHVDIACCWCGTHFFSFKEEIDHSDDEPNRPPELEN